MDGQRMRVPAKRNNHKRKAGRRTPEQGREERGSASAA